MPIYEYKCQSCGEKLEVIQKFSDAPLTVHEGCGGALERLISAAGLRFKGSGWYVTDYARSGKSGAANGKNEKSAGSPEKASSEKASSEKTPPANTDSKPAESSPSKSS